MATNSNSMKCSRCLKNITTRQYLNCKSCKKCFDINCANVPEKFFNSMERKKDWKCHDCIDEQRNTTPSIDTRSSNTSDGTIQTKQGSNMTLRKKITTTEKPSPCNTESMSPPLSPSIISLIKNEIHSAVSDANQKTVDSYFSKEFESIRNELSLLNDLKATIEFLSAEYERVKADLKCNEEKVICLTKHNTALTETVKDLSSRVSLLEQHARENNLEINGIPENKSENLITVVKQLGETLSVPLKDNDIITCVRVRKMDDASDRPRPLIVKLPCSRKRDEIIAATSKFNKSNPTEKLHTGHLGYGGKKTPVYVSEHLSPYFKHLHAQTRQFARENNHKYVWIRNGRIFIRKDDNSPAKQIRNEDSFKNILLL